MPLALATATGPVLTRDTHLAARHAGRAARSPAAEAIIRPAAGEPGLAALTADAGERQVAQRQRIGALWGGAAAAPTTPALPVVQRRYVGDPARHHMHVEIAQPHYKNGKSRGSRIDIGPEGAYRQTDLEAVIETVKTRLGEPGAQDCRDWSLAEARALKAARNA